MQRNPHAQKLTWKQFLELCEKSGINEDDEIDIIDISWGGAEDFECKKDDDFGWHITLRSM